MIINKTVFRVVLSIIIPHAVLLSSATQGVSIHSRSKEEMEGIDSVVDAPELIAFYMYGLTGESYLRYLRATPNE